MAFGYDSVERAPQPLTVGDLMRKNVAGISQSADFDEVIDFIEHSHDNTYPVVDENNSVVGMISYSRLSSALFDPIVGSLVRAIDLATAVPELLHTDDPAPHALDLFKNAPTTASRSSRVTIHGSWSGWSANPM